MNRRYISVLLEEIERQADLLAEAGDYDELIYLHTLITHTRQKVDNTAVKVQIGYYRKDR